MKLWRHKCDEFTDRHKCDQCANATLARMREDVMGILNKAYALSRNPDVDVALFAVRKEIRAVLKPEKKDGIVS